MATPWRGTPALAALFALVMAVAFFPLPADDAWIVARYVEQLHAGQGLVFNVGERVNALTSPLHTLVLAALRSVTAHPVTPYRVASAALAAAVLLMVARRALPTAGARATFLAFTLASPFVVFWSVGGLETPLLLAIVTALASLAIGRVTPPRAAAMLLLAGAAVLARYDAALFAGPVALAVLVEHRHAPRVRLGAIAAALLVLAWLAFTLAYYRDLLPTSFYVKAGQGPGAAELARGALYLASALVLCGAWLLVGPRRRARGEADAGVPAWPPASLAWSAVQLGLVLELAYGVWAGTKHMMYAYRLYVPYLPVLALVLLHAPRAARLHHGRRVAALLVLDAACAVALYRYSENPNLSLLALPQSIDSEVFEFSTIGARHTASFIAAVRRQAPDIRRDWATRPQAGSRAPRILVSTGGVLPDALPDAYVLELLVSYRHACRPPLLPMADYEQVIYLERAEAAIAREREAQGASVIGREALTIDGIDAPMQLRVETWYVGARMPVVLPGDVNAPCRSP